MVLLKRTIRQRTSALRLFSIALLSCRWSPGPEERLEAKRTRFQLRAHSHKVSYGALGTIPQPDDQTRVCVLCRYNNCGDVYCCVIQLTIDPNSLKHSLVYRKM